MEETAEQCRHCTNRETSTNHPLLCTKLPSKYPKDINLLDNQYIMPFKLNYAKLRDAVQLTHEKIKTNSWSNEEAKHYLWVFGINNDAITKIIEHALNQRLFEYAENERHTMPRE